MEAASKRGGERRCTAVELVCSMRFEEEARRSRPRGRSRRRRGGLAAHSAAPSSLAAVVLGEGFVTEGIDDSKRAHRAPARGARRAHPRRARSGSGSGSPTTEEIDRVNILRATLVAMKRASCSRCPSSPTCCWWTRLTVPGIKVEQLPIVKGDAQSASIAAASIVAKVLRDALMERARPRAPRLRPRAQHGLRERGAPPGAAAPGALADPPPDLRRRLPALALLVRTRS